VLHQIDGHKSRHHFKTSDLRRRLSPSSLLCSPSYTPPSATCTLSCLRRRLPLLVSSALVSPPFSCLPGLRISTSSSTPPSTSYHLLCVLPCAVVYTLLRHHLPLQHLTHRCHLPLMPSYLLRRRVSALSSRSCLLRVSFNLRLPLLCASSGIFYPSAPPLPPNSAVVVSPLRHRPSLCLLK
jgi:hypothetical protein